jgi:hypothetical protein
VNLTVEHAPEALVSGLIQRAERNSRLLQSELLAILETAANQEPS